jgi:hypothetical protein
VATKHIPYPSQCPPEGSYAKDGTFYRLGEAQHVVGDKLAAGSWRKPYKVRNSDVYERPDICEAHSLSLFENLEVLLNARKLSNWANKKSVARVGLVKSDGLVLPTSSDLCTGHFEFWPSPIDHFPAAVVVELATAA